MKNYLTVFLTAIFCVTCNIKKYISVEEISIINVEEHLNLKDHCKILMIGITTKHQIKQNLNCDSGSRAF